MNASILCVRLVFLAITYYVLALNAIAGVAPPSKPLHRIGFEILGPQEIEDPQVSGNLKGAMIKQDSELLRLAEEIEEAQRGKYWAKAESLKSMVDRLMGGKFCSVCFQGDGWKSPEELTKTELDEFARRIKEVSAELQKIFDAEYATLLAADKLYRVGLFYGGYEYVHERYVRETQIVNSWKVVESIMEKNVVMRQKCMGIPIELLMDAMSCPKPSIDPVELREGQVCPRCKGSGLSPEKSLCNVCSGNGKVRYCMPSKTNSTSNVRSKGM